RQDEPPSKSTKPGGNRTSLVEFLGPAGMKVYVRDEAGNFLPRPDGVVPGRIALRQGKTHRLKLAGIPGPPGLEAYPTVEIPDQNDRSAPLLERNPIAVELTPADFQRVAAGGFVIKVAFLPTPGRRDAAKDDAGSNSTARVLASYEHAGTDVTEKAAKQG